MPPNVLVIEEGTAAVSEAVTRACTDLGLTSSVVRTHAEGLARYTQLAPALVVVVLQDPSEPRGIALLEALRGCSPDLPSSMIAVTGPATEPNAHIDLATRFALRGVVPTPFRLEELRRIMVVALGLHRCTPSQPMPAVTPSQAMAAAPPSRPSPAARPTSAPSAARPTSGNPAAPPTATRTAVTPRTGVPATESRPVSAGSRSIAPFDTSLTEKPALRLFVELHRAQAEGVLEITRGQARKRLYLERGFFRYATSNARAETLAGFLAARGMAPARIDQAIEQARKTGATLADTLVQQGLVPAKEMPALLVAQTEEVAITTFLWPDAQVSFRPTSVADVPVARSNPALCALRAVLRYVSPEQARTRLKPNASAVLERTPHVDRELFAISTLFAGTAVFPSINGQNTVGELLASAKDVDALLLYALVATGLGRLRESPPTRELARPPTALISAAQAPKRPYTPAEEQARDLLRAEIRRLEGCTTHFQVLGVPTSAGPQAIKQAYVVLAKRFHSDAFAGLELGELAPVIQQIFTRLSEANLVLSDPARRKEYELSLQPAGIRPPTRSHDALKSEDIVRRASILRSAGRLREAERLFRQALVLNPTDPVCLAELGRLVFQLQGPSGEKEALGMLDEVIRSGPAASATQARFYKAQILLETDDPQLAMELLRKVVADQPDHPQALGTLRLAKQQLQAVQSQSKGLFARLLGDARPSSGGKGPRR